LRNLVKSKKTSVLTWPQDKLGHKESWRETIPPPATTSAAASGPVTHKSLHLAEPLRLASGVTQTDVVQAYETYGTLNDDRSNAILLCHALTGDQYAGGVHPVTGKPGWFDHLIGPGKVIDTDRFFVICINVLGGCMGSTGPKEINPETGSPYGLSFPGITVADMVTAQERLLAQLDIPSLFCVLGGSMGGMQVLEWASRYPDKVFSAVPIASSYRHSAQNIAFHEVGRQAIMADPDWRGGDYLSAGVMPQRGLAVARMTAHITYLSEAGLHRKFGRRLQDRDAPTFGFDADFQVESHLRRPVRRQQLFVHHPGDGLLRPPGAAWGRSIGGVSRDTCPVLPDHVHLRLAVSDSGKPGDRSCPQRRCGGRELR